MSSTSQQSFLEKSYQSRAGNPDLYYSQRSAANELGPSRVVLARQEDSRDVLSVQRMAGEVQDEAVDDKEEEEEQLLDRLTGVDDNLGR